MPDCVIPLLLCPFKSAVHPWAVAVEQDAVRRWAQRLGFKPTQKAFLKLKGSRFGMLLSQCHPHATVEDLELIIDFAIWLFFWDDQFDTAVGGERLLAPEQVQRLNERAAALLEGAAVEPDEGVLMWSLVELRERLTQRMSEGWWRRFVRDLEGYLAATVQESAYRRALRQPDVAEYIHLRRQSGGVYPMLDLIEVATGCELSAEASRHPLVRELMSTTVDIVCWANDLFSLENDLADAGHLSLVFSLEQHLGLPLQEALNLAASMHDAEVRNFIGLEQGLLCFNEAQDAAQDAAVVSYVDGLKSWIRANVDWSVMTGRYHVGNGPELSNAALAG